MSSIFSKNNKELAGVKIVSANDVWSVKNKKVRLRNDISIVGKVDASFPNFIMKATNKNCKTGYVDDVFALPKRAKNDLINHFYDNKGIRTRHRGAYIVRTDKKASTRSNKK